MKPLTPRHVAVLRYVACHPGTPARPVAEALSLTPKQATHALEVLYVMRLVGRQAPLWGSVAPQTWYCEPLGVEAAQLERTT